MTTSDRAPLSVRAERMLASLDAWPRKRVPLQNLWQVLDEADPATRTFVHRRSLLADTLHEMADAGLIALPGRQSYDRTEQPPLPRFVTLPGPARENIAPRPVIWHPSLSWADAEPVAPTHRGVLESVNRWLFHHRDELIVPLRERSLEILGDEKAFDRLHPTSLFGNGRLNLELLKAKRVAPPMHHVHIGDGTLLLIVENSDTFDSLSTALRRSPGRVGLVAWGAGTAFEASVLSVGQLPYPVSDIAYFGDLDAKGLQVPANASRQAVTVGLPVIRPATGLYAALQTLGRPQPGQKRLSNMDAERHTAWLGEAQRHWAAELLCAGSRVAQESVGLAYLTRHDEWQADL